MSLSQPPILGFETLYLLVGIVQQQAKGLHIQHDSQALVGLRHRGFPDRPPNVTIRLRSERFTLNFTKASVSTSLLNSTPPYKFSVSIY